MSEMEEGEGAPLAGGALSKLPLHDGAGKPEIKPPRENSHIRFQDAVSTEFDAEIALALTASGWRATAALLTLAAKCIEAGDFLSAERNRQSAREQFIAANDVFRRFQGARVAEGASFLAEAFK